MPLTNARNDPGFWRRSKKSTTGGFDTLHFLVTSRKERDIEEALDRMFSHEVYMHESLVDADIRVHISRTLDDDKRFSMCSAEEKGLVKTTLVNGAHGM
jgi:hypothetical protein